MIYKLFSASSYLRENAPHVKSCLLVGPEGSGKTMLLNAVCTELEAVLFDLTATNIVGRYPGKSGKALKSNYFILNAQFGSIYLIFMI